MNDDVTNSVIEGDCMEQLQSLEAESVHAVVTDPPYGLAFMGRDWDDFQPKEYQQWCEQWATECKRVLKPGGHLLAFSGNRTHHRLFTGVEDAGFEIRDTLTWHYGSGFPKASDISKTIDKRADAEREVVSETYVAPDGKERYGGRLDGDEYDSNDYGEYDGDATAQTKPATDAAKQWDGFKTGLKPATEYVVMARKPFDGATVDCVLEHGTGALNIDATRIGTEQRENSPAGSPNLPGDERTDAGKGMFDGTGTDESTTVEGRYPSNVIFDETEAERLDREVGDVTNSSYREGDRAAKSQDFNTHGTLANREGGHTAKGEGYEDSGGPSRYFYTSKASKSERTEDGSIANAHPTVKPQDLMEWLVKLVTAEGQIVLDPFAGSGTTLKAAKAVGRDFVGIEKQAQWADVARVRAGLTPHDPSHVRDTDDAQNGLEAYQ